jgi:hypothetical protein
MIGEQIGELKGKRTGRRVLSVDNFFKVEVSFESTGKVLGVEMNEVGTYSSQVRPDGSLYGEGQGIVMGKDGSMATWTGAGVGKINPDGAVSYRGAIYYSTASPKLARLTSVAVVFEYEVDPQGNTHSKLWEWK